MSVHHHSREHLTLAMNSTCPANTNVSRHLAWGPALPGKLCLHYNLPLFCLPQDGTQKSQKVFVNIPTEVGATEAEEIGSCTLVPSVCMVSAAVCMAHALGFYERRLSFGLR